MYDLIFLSVFLIYNYFSSHLLFCRDYYYFFFFTESNSHYAAGTRPFGQPLFLGGITKNGDKQSSSSPKTSTALNRQRSGTIKKKT